MNQHNFLDKEGFCTIKNLLPIEGWRPAKIYSVNEKKSYVNNVMRKSEKNYEKRRDVIRIIKKIVMKYVVRWMKKNVPNFRFCWVRNNQTEWIRYYEGDFFKPHKDFERYICNGMTPYVMILGLNDVEEGGETKVEDSILDGSSKENGVVLFQANLKHESLIVKKGIKIALKLEFFVYASDNFIKVYDKNKKWISYWSSYELNLLDNFFKSHLDFKNDSSKDIILSEELARDSFNLGFMIADPRLKLPSEIDLLFPGFTAQGIHDIFVIYRFLQDPSQKIIFCNDSLAWDYINQNMDISDNCGLYVGIWTKKKFYDKYKLQKYYDRKGSEFDYYSIKKKNDNGEYMDYDDLKIFILDKFMKIFDHYDEKKDKPVYKHGKIIENQYTGNVYKFTDEPSDAIQKPLFEGGKITYTEREFCNEEDAGYMTYTFTEYEQYYIQIRYFLVRT